MFLCFHILIILNGPVDYLKLHKLFHSDDRFIQSKRIVFIKRPGQFIILIPLAKVADSRGFTFVRN